MMTRTSIFTVFLCAVIAYDLGTVDCINVNIQAKIDDFIRTIMGCRKGIGMTLAVVHNNNTYVKGYGIKNVETGENVTTHTLFDIGSVSKHFGATLLGIMLDEHEGISWDTPVRDILGEDFFFYDGMRTNRTTLRDLASHSTGISRNDFMLSWENIRKLISDKVRFLRPYDQFRNSFRYTNVIYGLIAVVAEKLGQKSWEELLYEKIFEPIGMEASTYVTDPDLELLDMQTPYMTDIDDIREVSRLMLRVGDIGAEGGVLSNAMDMSKWLKLHLNKGANNDGQLIKESILQETYSAISIFPEILYEKPTFPFTYTRGRYGLGWMRGYYRELPMITHNGITFGFGTNLALLPDVNIGVFVSTTTGEDPHAVYLITMYIMDLLLNEEPWLNLTTACSFPHPWTQDSFHTENNLLFGSPFLSKTKSTSLKGDKSLFVLYEGVYGNFAYGNITVSQNNGALMLEFGRGNYALTQITSNLFTGQGIGNFWMISIPLIRFSSSSPDSPEIIDQVVILVDSDPPLFIKDLKMADAPLPPDPSACGT